MAHYDSRVQQTDWPDIILNSKIHQISTALNKCRDDYNSAVLQELKRRLEANGN